MKLGEDSPQLEIHIKSQTNARQTPQPQEQEDEDLYDLFILLE